MTIDTTLILRLEHLARLQLSEAEREALMADLNRILTMVETLQALDTKGVPPLVYVSGDAAQALREDAVAGQVAREAALANAPDQDGTYFRVPKVIDL